MSLSFRSNSLSETTQDDVPTNHFYTSLPDENALTDSERVRKLKANSAGELRAGVADGVVLGTIFSMFFTNYTQLLLEAFFKYLLFSAAAAVNVVLSAYAWRQAHLDMYKTGSVVKAVMQTIFTIPITIAVVGSLAFSGSVFATVIAPIMFAATLSVKFLYQAAAAIHYHGKSKHRDWVNDLDDGFEDGETYAFKQEKYRGMAKTYSAFAISTGLAVIAITNVFLFLKTSYAIFGLVAGVVGAGWTASLMNWGDSKADKTLHNGDERLVDEFNHTDGDEVEFDLNNNNSVRHQYGQLIDASDKRELDYQYDDSVLKDENDNSADAENDDGTPLKNRSGTAQANLLLAQQVPQSATVTSATFIDGKGVSHPNTLSSSNNQRAVHFSESGKHSPKTFGNGSPTAKTPLIGADAQQSDDLAQSVASTVRRRVNK